MKPLGLLVLTLLLFLSLASTAVAEEIPSISGRITDSVTGLPVQGAKVEVIIVGTVISSAKTSLDGTYTVTGLTSGTDYKVCCTHTFDETWGMWTWSYPAYNAQWWQGKPDYYAADKIQLNPGEQRTGMDMALIPASGSELMRGTVRDAQTGLPVAGIWVMPGKLSSFSYRNTSGGYSYIYYNDFRYKALTGADGTYTFRVAGSTNFMILTFEDISLRRYHRQLYTNTPGGTLDFQNATQIAPPFSIDATLIPVGMCSVKGGISSTYSGKAIPGLSAEVDLYSQSNGVWSLVASAPVDATGQYWQLLASGSYKIAYRAEGYETTYHFGGSSLASAPVVPISGPVILNGQLKPAGLWGNVRDTSGNGLVGAEATLFRLASNNTWEQVASKLSITGGQHDFMIGPAGSYRIKFEAPHYVSKWWSATGGDDDVGTIVLGPGEYRRGVDTTLSPDGVAIRGTVTGRAGALAGARLLLVQNASVVASTTSAADGTYSLGSQQLATWNPEFELQVSADDYDDASVPLTLTRGENRTGVDVTLEWTVVDLDAPPAPVASATYINSSAIRIGWAAVVDALSGTSHYAVLTPDGSVLATTTETSFLCQEITPDSRFGYYVKAVDRAGNESPRSNAARPVIPAGTDMSWGWMRVWPTDQWAYGVSIDRYDNVYFATGGRVGRRDALGGSPTSLGGWDDYSTDVSIDSQGRMYVLGSASSAEGGIDRISIYEPTGEFVARWEKHGSGQEDLNSALGLVVTGESVYVADTLNNRVQQYTTSGIWVRSIGSTGTGDGQFDMPSDVAVDSDGNLYVVDRGNARVEKFTATGEFLESWGHYGWEADADTFVTPEGIAVDRTGVVYVTDVSRRRVTAYAPDGQAWVIWQGEIGSGPGEFYLMRQIAVDPLGNFVYVGDDQIEATSRVQKFARVSQTAFSEAAPASLVGLRSLALHAPSSASRVASAEGVMSVRDESTGVEVSYEHAGADGVVVVVPEDDYSLPTGGKLVPGGGFGIACTTETSGSVEVTIPLPPGVPLVAPRLLHMVDGAWEDITTRTDVASLTISGGGAVGDRAFAVVDFASGEVPDMRRPVTVLTALLPEDWCTVKPIGFSLRAFDSGNPDPPLTHYSVDGGASQDYSGWTEISKEGTSTIAYWSSDAAGNTEPPMTATIRIDTRSPVTDVLPASVEAWTNAAGVTVSFEATDGTSGLGVTRYRRDAGAVEEYAGPIVTSAEGVHPIQYWSEDVAGNSEPTKTITVRIDRTKPVTTDDHVAAYNGSARVHLTAGDGGASGVARTEWRLGASDWASGTVVDIAAMGTHTLEYRSTDMAGNVEDIKQTTIEVHYPSAVTLSSKSNSSLGYGVAFAIRGTLKGAAFGLSNRRVVLQSRVPGAAFKDTSLTATSTLTGAFAFSAKPTTKTYYRVRFAGSSDYATSESTSSLYATPRVYVRTPVAPRVMSHSRSYTIYGYLKPRHTSGTYPVRIRKYRRVSGRWRSYGYVKAKVSNYSGYSKYSAKVRLSIKGSWRLRAYAPGDSGHAATSSSGYDYVRVR